MFLKTTDYNSSKLFEATKKAQQSLRMVLGDSSIKLIVIENCNDQPEVKIEYNKAWRNDDPANWNFYFNRLVHVSNGFIIAMEQQSQLSGLCFFDLMDKETPAERLRIHTIERNQSHQSVKGLIISSFCQVALDISIGLDIRRVSVLQPQVNTRPSYLRLGFSKSSRNEFDLPIEKDTKINWPVALEHRNSKLLPATP